MDDDDFGGYRPHYVIPQVRFVRPCLRIEPDAMADVAIRGPAEMWRVLTDDLPLEGGPAMKRLSCGRLKLVAHLRVAAPWLSPAIDRIEEQLELAAWAGRPWLAMRPLVLVGPPGCGKSHVARLLAEAADAGFGALDLGGTSDARTLEGTARGWNAAQPCFPAVLMAQTTSANPVVLLEEIDKASGSHANGDPLAVLLTMIEPSTARRYYDKCLMAPFDLSHVVWLATANRADLLPKPLLSRVDVVAVRGPGPEHAPALVRTLWHLVARDLGVASAMMPGLAPEVEQAMADAFARSGSVRRLRRAVEAVLVAAVRGTRQPIH